MLGSGWDLEDERALHRAIGVAPELPNRADIELEGSLRPGYTVLIAALAMSDVHVDLRELAAQAKCLVPAQREVMPFFAAFILHVDF